MNNPLRIPSISKCTEIFGHTEGVELYKALEKAEFRNDVSLHDQLIFLKNSRKSITVREITKLFNISNEHYYKALKNEQKIEVIVNRPPSRQLLTEIEENSIIELIHLQQQLKDYLDGAGIRAAEDFYKVRTGIERSFSRDCLKDFRERHKN